MKTLVGILVLGVSLAVGLFGQTTSVAGTRSADPTGAVIPKAVVSVTNTQTGAKRSDTSDSQGRYTIPQLTPGTYKMTAQVVGFNDVTIQRIELLVNTPATVNVIFDKVGSTTTTVQVEGAAAQLNTVDASLGNVITSRRSSNCRRSRAASPTCSASSPESLSSASRPVPPASQTTATAPSTADAPTSRTSRSMAPTSTSRTIARPLAPYYASPRTRWRNSGPPLERRRRHRQRFRRRHHPGHQIRHQRLPRFALRVPPRQRNRRQRLLQ